MVTYVVRNENGTVIVKGTNYRKVKKERMLYERQTGRASSIASTTDKIIPFQVDNEETGLMLRRILSCNK